MEMPPVIIHLSNDMSEFLLQRNYMSIIYVVKPLVDALTLAIMMQCTLERNPRDVMNVEEPSASAVTFIDTRHQSTQGRNAAAFSQNSSLSLHRNLRVKQEGKQQMSTRRRKPYGKYQIIHVREAI